MLNKILAVVLLGCGFALSGASQGSASSSSSSLPSVGMASAANAAANAYFVLLSKTPGSQALLSAASKAYAADPTNPFFKQAVEAHQKAIDRKKKRVVKKGASGLAKTTIQRDDNKTKPKPTVNDVERVKREYRKTKEYVDAYRQGAGYQQYQHDLVDWHAQQAAGTAASSSTNSSSSASAGSTSSSSSSSQTSQQQSSAVSAAAAAQAPAKK